MTTKKYFFCRNVNCPEFHSWKPGESCKISAVNNIFHSAKHKCIVPGVKYCWVHQSQVAGWTLHTKGSEAAKKLCTEKNSPWTGGWIEIPEAPNVEPVTGTHFNKRRIEDVAVPAPVPAPDPEEIQLQDWQKRHVLTALVHMLVPPSSPAVLSADLLQAARDCSDTLAELDDELLFNSDVQGERCVGCNVQLHIQAFQGVKLRDARGRLKLFCLVCQSMQETRRIRTIPKKELRHMQVHLNAATSDTLVPFPRIHEEVLERLVKLSLAEFHVLVVSTLLTPKKNVKGDWRFIIPNKEVKQHGLVSAVMNAYEQGQYLQWTWALDDGLAVLPGTVRKLWDVREAYKAQEWGWEYARGYQDYIDTQCNLSSCYLPEPMQAAENPEEDDDVELEQEEPQGGNCRYKSRLSPMFSQHWNLTLLVLASQPSLLNLWTSRLPACSLREACSCCQGAAG
ncbi:TPA: hypothetical protein ACH3X2_003217 [Trebouxia sp. C0005]